MSLARNRSIPRAVKRLLQTPQRTPKILSHLVQQQDLVFPFREEFVRNVLSHSAETNTTHHAPYGPSQSLPFYVFRTRSSQIPVYVRYKSHRNQATTIVKHVHGDLEAFESELSRVCDGQRVIRLASHFEVRGNFVSRVQVWLRALGF